MTIQRSKTLLLTFCVFVSSFRLCLCSQQDGGVPATQNVTMPHGTRIILETKYFPIEELYDVNDTDVLLRVVDTCGICTSDGRIAGQLEQTQYPNIQYNNFFLDELKNGLIAFQHNYLVGSDEISITLRLSADGLEDRNITIYVNPFMGEINLISEPLLVAIEGTTTVLKQEYLNTSTNFQTSQFPILYNSTISLKYGELQVYENSPSALDTWEWVQIQEREMGSRNCFSQMEVNEGYVRYVQNPLKLPQNEYVNDSFQFHVCSYQLCAPLDTFRILILSNSTVVHPKLVIQGANITLLEGREVPITDRSFSLSFFPSVLLVDSWEHMIAVNEVDIDIFIVQPPKHGMLILNNAHFNLTSLPYPELSLGLFLYEHDGTENFIDEIVFNFVPTSVKDLPVLLPDPTSNVTIHISIEPVNDNPPELVQQIPINPLEGSIVTLNTMMLEIIDIDGSTDYEITLLMDTLDEEPNGHFANGSADLLAKLSSFKYSEVVNGEIVFKFDTLGKPLDYGQRVSISDGLLLTTAVLNISAIPINISASINTQDPNCPLIVDVISDVLSIPLRQEILDIDMDQPERLSEVTVRILQQPSQGVLFSEDLDENTDLFSFTLIMEGGITYTLTDKFDQNTSDSFVLQFSLGHGQSYPLTIPVCINPLPYPILTHIGTLIVQILGENDLTADILQANERHRLDTNYDELVFELVSTPQYGLILEKGNDMSVTSLTSFTQADINSHRVFYLNKRHNEQSNLTDGFHVRLRNQYYQLDEIYSVVITVKATELEIVNTGFTIIEGGQQNITSDKLFATAPEEHSITFYVGEHPIDGDLILQRTPSSPEVKHPQFFSPEDIKSGYISYRHNHTECPMDNFQFHVYAIPDNPNLPTLYFLGLVNITVNLINDHVPFEKRNEVLNVVEGTSHAITTEYLKYEDDDYGYNIDNLLYQAKLDFYAGGEICLRDKCAGDQDTFEWHQRDMNGDLIYRHIQNENIHFGAAILLLNVSDGRYYVDSGVFVILIKDIVATRVGNRELFVTENEHSPLHINFTTNDMSVQSTEYEYRIVTPPLHGNLLKDGSPVDSFSQKDIDDGKIVYDHDGGNDAYDSFEFNLTVRTFESSNYFVHIIINPVDDDIPVLNRNEVIVVKRSSVVHINESQLLIRDADTSDLNLLEFVILVPPVFGVLEKRTSMMSDEYETLTILGSFTQQDIKDKNIRYSNTYLDMWSDEFLFYISDGTNDQSDVYYTAQIAVVPDIVPIVTHGMTLNEGEKALFNSSMIEIGHPYISTVEGKISIFDYVKNGRLIINDVSCDELACDFSTNDLADGNVYYEHNGEETTHDSFIFFIQWPNLPRTNLETFNITIVHINDLLPKVINASLNISASQITTITKEHLLTVDGDTPPERIRYHFDLTPDQLLDGHFTFVDSPEYVNNTFTQADINKGIILFVDTHDYDGIRNLTFDVSDEDFKVSGVFRVKARVVEISLSMNKAPKVEIGGNHTLTNNNLDYTTNNKDINTSMILYTIVEDFKYGKLFFTARTDGTLPDNNAFSQFDIYSGRVTYVHTHTEYWESRDSMNFSVSTPMALQNVSDSMGINIKLSDDPCTPFDCNRSLEVIEGGRTCLNLSFLDTRNIRYYTWKQKQYEYSFDDVKLEYNLTDLPRYGVLKLGQTPINSSHVDLTNVCYENENNGSENFTDSFRFEILVKANEMVLNITSGVMRISVTPVNDEDPILITKKPHKIFANGFESIITSNDLKVSDLDNNPDELVYIIVKPPKLGILRKQGGEGTESFTQEDVDENRLKFVPNQTGNTSFSFTFNDGIHSSSDYQFDIFIEDHYLKILGADNLLLQYYQTNRGPVIGTEILNSETNGFRNQTIYNVINPPLHGEIRVSGVPSSNFSQSEVDAGIVKYRQTNFSYHKDEIILSGSNLDIISNNFTLHVLVQADVVIKENVILPPSLSVALPDDLIQLKSLQTTIQITSFLTYGFLSFKYPNREVNKNRITEFQYFDLINEYVYFTWILRDDIQEGMNYTENISGLVLLDDYPPGEFHLSLILQAPPPSVITSTMPTNEPTDTPENDNPGQDFKYTVYVPMLGLILVLIILVVVVAIFCCTQSRNFRHKLNRKSSISFPRSSPPRECMSPQLSPSNPHHSPVTGGFDREYSDSDTSSAADIMMVQNNTQSLSPMMTISASHTYLHPPHPQSSQEYSSSSGYHTHTTVPTQITPGSDNDFNQVQHRQIESPFGIPHPMYSPSGLDNSYVFGRGSEFRSSSPVRRVNQIHRNARPYASLTKVNGRNSPLKCFRDYNIPSTLHSLHPTPHLQESTSSDGYDSSSMTQESIRQVSIPTPINLEPVIKRNGASNLYKTSHPVLKAPQYWV